jgi:D-lactate dehydrogenase (cytochrome)
MIPVTTESLATRVPDVAVALLHQLLGDRLSTATPVREQHGKDASHHPCVPPEAVAFAQSTGEVSEIVKICARHKVPIIPFGSGTGLEGHVAALSGGVCIDISRMNEILRVSIGDLDATVQAGVTRGQLNEHLHDSGLFFSVDPGANASLGGMAATRASGTTAVRYGTMRENVLSLTVVLPDGRVIRTARRARKSAAGYDLTRLFVGSEGTLGVITEVTVRLYGIPSAISAATCSFPSVESAVNTVIQTIQAGIPVARIELADASAMDSIIRYSKLDLPVAPMLWMEFHGTEKSAAGRGVLVDRCLRADFPVGPVHHRDANGHRRFLSSGRHSRACGRRQFSRRLHAQSERTEGDGGGPATQPTTGLSCARSRRHLHRRARDRPRQDRRLAR